MNIPKPVHTLALVLAGVGAVNWGLSSFLNFNLLSFLPAGIIEKLLVAAIAASGAYVLYALYDKKL